MHLAGQNTRNLAQLNFDYHIQIQSFLELLDMVIDMQNRNPIFQYVYVGQHIRTFIFHQFIPIQWILWAKVYNHDRSGHILIRLF